MLLPGDPRRDAKLPGDLVSFFVLVKARQCRLDVINRTMSKVAEVDESWLTLPTAATTLESREDHPKGTANSKGEQHDGDDRCRQMEAMGIVEDATCDQ